MIKILLRAVRRLTAIGLLFITIIPVVLISVLFLKEPTDLLDPWLDFIIDRVGDFD